MTITFADDLSGGAEINRRPVTPRSLPQEIVVARLSALFDMVAIKDGSIADLAHLMSVGIYELRRRSQEADNARLEDWQRDGLIRSFVAAFQRLRPHPTIAEVISDKFYSLGGQFCVALIRYWASSATRRSFSGENLQDLNDISLLLQTSLLQIALQDEILSRGQDRARRTTAVVSSLLTETIEESKARSA